MHNARISRPFACCVLCLCSACASKPAATAQVADGARSVAGAGPAQFMPVSPVVDAGHAQPAAAGAMALADAGAPQPAAAGHAGASPSTPSGGAGASAAHAGAGGQAGASSAGQVAAAIAPMERSGKYVLESGDFSFEIDPSHGARITRLALAGQNLLTGPEIDSLNYGSTFWPSPQERWNWPPVPELDSDAYTAQLEGDSLVCASKPGMRAKVSVQKRVRASADASVELEYTLKNEDSMPASWAPWEVTRVAAGGLSFFPTGERVVNAQLPVMNQGGATWYKHDGSKVGSGQKLTADAAMGFLAHVAGRTLFVKQFMDVPPAQQAPAPEAEIAIYAAASYVELEPQGPYTALMPGEKVTWRVRWRLAHVPDDVPIEVGSSKLLELARQLATF